MFGKKSIQDGVHMPLFTVQNEPEIHYSEICPNGQKIDKYYTFIIVDPDAPTGPHIHQCIYNIPGDKVKMGTVLLPYYPPTPPKGSGEHRYFCILYEQSDKITKPPLVNKEKRAYKKFDDFKKELEKGNDSFPNSHDPPKVNGMESKKRGKKFNISLIPIASKFFICEYGK
jgi:phosphatidylethanolamine-binding protein (PEBP) family uncharacterized protein